MHDNKPNNFCIKYFFIVFQIGELQRLFDTFVPLGMYVGIYKYKYVCTYNILIFINLRDKCK
jgi:hypothetical protein